MPFFEETIPSSQAFSVVRFCGSLETALRSIKTVSFARLTRSIDADVYITGMVVQPSTGIERLLVRSVSCTCSMAVAKAISRMIVPEGTMMMIRSQGNFHADGIVSALTR